MIFIFLFLYFLILYKVIIKVLYWGPGYNSVGRVHAKQHPTTELHLLPLYYMFLKEKF